MLLKDLRVAITGANGTLGRAVAAEAAATGASLALIDLALPELRPGPASRATYHAVDLTRANETRRCFEEVGPVDALFNIAGGFAMGEAVHEISDAAWDRMFELNVKTTLYCSRSVVPKMIERRRGRIVNVGATSARSGQAFMAAYVASKSTVIRITESMSSELMHKGINVNCVLPSIIDTPSNRAAMPDTNPAEWVSPVDLARVMCFLASDHARAIHGASIPVTNLV